MKHTITICLTVLLCINFSCLAADLPDITETIDVLLTEVDSTLDQSEELCQSKEIRMDGVRTKLKGSTIPEQRYFLAQELYHEYSTYDSDSAMHYANCVWTSPRA